MLLKHRVEALGLDYDKLQALLDKADELDAALTAAVTARDNYFAEASKALVYICSDGAVYDAGEHQLWYYLTDEHCSYVVCRADDTAAIKAASRRGLEALAKRQRAQLETTLESLVKSLRELT